MFGFGKIKGESVVVTVETIIRTLHEDGYVEVYNKDIPKALQVLFDGVDRVNVYYTLSLIPVGVPLMEFGGAATLETVKRITKNSNWIRLQVDAIGRLSLVMPERRTFW